MQSEMLQESSLNIQPIEFIQESLLGGDNS